MQGNIGEEQTQDAGVEAYIYLYPLVLMDLTRRQMTNIEAGRMPGRGPINQFAHVREFPAADWRDVVRPNFDTLYSAAWLDLSQGPLVVSTTGTDGRYFLLPMLDMWTDVFATPGKRTSGTGPQRYAVLPPGWQSELPPDLEAVQAPTRHVWVIGRTQTNGPDDYEAVRAVQDGYAVEGVAGGGPVGDPPAIDPTVDMTTPPLEQITSMDAADFFTYAAELMTLHPPHVTDWSQLARARRIGLVPGERLDWEALPADVRRALEGAPAAGQAAMQAKLPTLAPVVNNWLVMADSIGVYGDYYLKRAIIAMAGLGANQPEDAIYPLALGDEDGRPLSGEHDYVIHFDAGALPPVDAFWSVTMYDAEGFQSANEINRFAIGDRDALTYNDDGSLDLYLQHQDPGPEKRPNWLPSPVGPLGVTMRLYAPGTAALRGEWAPPPVRIA